MSICASVPLYYYNYEKKKKFFRRQWFFSFRDTCANLCLIEILRKLEINKFIFSVSVLFYPLMDLLRAIVIRLKSGNSPFVADRNHLHHKLSDWLNGNHFLTVVIMQLFSIVIFYLLVTITS